MSGRSEKRISQGPGVQVGVGVAVSSGVGVLVGDAVLLGLAVFVGLDVAVRVAAGTDVRVAVGSGGGGPPVVGIHITASNQTLRPNSPVKSSR